MLQAIVAFLVVSVLALAHIHLQFAIRDLRLQHRKYQEQYESLVQKESRIQHENEAFCDSSRLRSYGRAMSMIEDDILSRNVAVVPGPLMHKYQANRAPVQALAQVRAEQESRELTVKKVLYSLADVNKALASGVN